MVLKRFHLALSHTGVGEMDHAISLREHKSARLQRNFLLLTVLLLLTIVSMQAYALVKRENVVILTPTIVQDGTVAYGGNVDARYIEALARDAIQSLLNVAPLTTDYPRTTLSRLAAPTYRPELLEFFDGIIQDVRKRKISTVFFLETLDTNVFTKEVFVNGRLKTYLGATEVKSDPKRYRVAFGDFNGSVRITKISELEPET
jgi:type IV conjugative transfer system protein TraE